MKKKIGILENDIYIFSHISPMGTALILQNFQECDEILIQIKYYNNFNQYSYTRDFYRF